MKFITCLNLSEGLMREEGANKVSLAVASIGLSDYSSLAKLQVASCKLLLPQGELQPGSREGRGKKQGR